MKKRMSFLLLGLCLTLQSIGQVNFVGEKGLTEEEIQLISDWVDAGSQLGTPDLVLEMSEDYFIKGNNQDDYRVFVLPTGLTEDKEL